MKNYATLICIFVIAISLQSCSTSKSTAVTGSKKSAPVLSGINRTSNVPARHIDTKNVDANELVQFAEKLSGIKYKYGSAVKEQGFDCSGFIYYVFNHFNIKVPRSSKDFTNAGTEVNPAVSKKGDLILFTGTDTTGWVVGHMGIITQNNGGNIQFIHSASGNNKGVMISAMSSYFITRFVKVIRVFN